MATDHDFKIKNGARVSGEKLILGSAAYAADSNYVGLKTSVMDGNSDYMIISASTDQNTYISAGAGSAVYIRGGGNNTSHQLVINSSQALFHGVVNLSSNSSLRVSGTTVLTSARNLTNIGTISSAAITSSDLIKTTSAKGFMVDNTVDLSMSYYNQVPSTSWAIFTTNNHADTILSTNLKVDASHDIVVNQTHSTMKGSGIVFTGNGHSAGENAIAFYAFGDNDGGTAGDVINEEDWAAKLTGSGFEVDGTISSGAITATNTGNAVVAKYNASNYTALRYDGVDTVAGGDGVYRRGGTEKLRLTTGGVTITGTAATTGSLTMNGANLIFASNISGDGKLYFNGHGGASNYNYFLKADNDTGRKAVMFVNGSTRTADGGANTFTVRNDGGPSRFGNSSYVTTLEGSTIKANGTTQVVLSEFNITSGSAYTTHFNYQNNGQNYISQGNSGLTQFRNSNGTLMEIASTGNVTISNDLTVSGNLTISGTTTTLNTATLQVEDKNIVLNYGTGDTSGSADGAGITIQDAVNSSTNATMNWNASNDEFVFSHKVTTLGNFQTAGNIFANSVNVLNSAGNGWHTWATRNNNKVDLNVGSITSGALSATGNSTITGSGSSSNALNVYRGSDSASAFRVLNTGEVLVSSNYFYVDASQGAYFNGNLRARGGISNDGSNYNGEVRILDTTDIVGDVKANIFYDRNNTAYFLDPNTSGDSLKVAGNIKLGRHVDALNVWDGTGNSRKALFLGWYSDKVILGNNDDSGHDTAYNYNDDAVLSVNPFYGYMDVTSRTALRAPIFYDTDNTTYYANPGNNSILYSASIGHTSAPSGGYSLRVGSIQSANGSIDYLSQVHFNDNVRFYDDGNDSYLNYKYGDAGAGGIRFRNGSGTTQGFVYSDNANIGFLSSDGSWSLQTNNSVVYAYHQFRAPSFYDMDDTSYYVNPDSGGFVLKGGTSNRVTFTTNDSGFKVSNPEGTGANDLRLGAAWGRVGIYNNNVLSVMSDSTSGIHFVIDNTTYGELNTDYLSHTSDIRAPLFYDSNNTGFYLDPANSSFFNQLSASKLQVDSNLVLDLTNNSTARGPWNPIASSIRSSGYPVYNDEDFQQGLNGVGVYNNSGGNAVTISRVTASSESLGGVPNSSGYVVKIAYLSSNTNGSSPGFGGFHHNIPSEENHTFVQVFQAKLPSGRSLNIAENPQGNNNTSYWLTNNVGTGKWEWYVRVSHCGTGGTFSSGGHVYVTGGTNANFTWYLASINVYDVTEANHKRAYQYTANSRMDSPIYYDSGNTAYYTNPDGTSVLSKLSVGTTSLSSGYDMQLGGPINMVNNAIHYAAEIHFNANSRFTGVSSETLDFKAEHSSNAYLRFRDGGGNIKGGVYGSGTSIGLLDSDSNWAIKHDRDNRTGFFINNVEKGFLTNAQLTHVESVRAPIFYDKNNTQYYADPASTSEFNRINQATVSINEGDGQGIGFWNDVGGGAYSIWMSATSNSTYGGRVTGETTSDYNMYFGMDHGTNRGFVFRNGSTIHSGIDASGNARFNGSVVAGTAGTQSTFQARYNASDSYHGALGWNYLQLGNNGANRINAGRTQTGGHLDIHTNVTGTNTGGTHAARFDTAGNVYSYGSSRSPIFYDSNNSGYYAHLDGSSNLNNLSANTTTLGKIKFKGEGTNSNQTNDRYAIYQEAGAWSNPFPDLIIGYHTGIKIGGYTGYGGTRFYNDNPTNGTEIFSVGNGDNHVRVVNNLYAPIIYDKDNTAYYLDPASTTNINHLNALGGGKIVVQGGTNGGTARGIFMWTQSDPNWGIYMSTPGSTNNIAGGSAPSGLNGESSHSLRFRIAANSTNGFIWENSNNATLMSMKGTAGDLVTGSSMRAPIFYDSNDTTYYTNPNGMSELLDLRTGRDYHTNTPRWDTSFYVCQSQHFYGHSNTGDIYVGEGNTVNIRSIGKASGSFRAPIFYDSANTGFYLDAAGTSLLSTVKADDVAPKNAIMEFTGVANGSFSFTNPSGGSAHYTARGNRVLTSNSSGWHQDGEDPTIAIVDSHTGTDIDSAGIGLIMHNEANTTNAYSPGMMWTARSNSSNYDSMYAAVYGRKTGTGPDTNWNAGELHFFTTPASAYVTSTPDLRMWNHGDAEFKTSVRAPTFYDKDNAAYYTNPAGNSNQVTLTLNNGGGNGSGEGLVVNGSGDIRLTSGGSLFFGAYNYGASTYIRGYDNSSGFQFRVDGTLRSVIESAQLTHNSSIRSPIFYDVDNTSYYLDPASTSQLSVVRMATLTAGTSSTAMSSAGQIAVHSSGNPYISFHSGGGTARSAYFQHLTDSDRFLFGEVAFTQSNGSFRAPLFYDTEDTNFYLDPHNQSRVDKLRGRALGANMAGNQASGDGLSLYGNYTNGEPTYGMMFSGRATFGGHGPMGNTDWATYFTMNNDNSRGWIFRRVGSGNSASITAAGLATFDSSVRSPAFYDSNNTSYYSDNASTSRFNVIHSNDYKTEAGDGRGIGFWNGAGGSSYSIFMSSATNGTYGGRVGGETTSDYNMYFRMGGGTNRGWVFTNGAANPVAGIDASGNIRAEGNVVAYSASDRKLKDNIKPIENALDKVCALNGYTFNWNDQQTIHEAGKADVGVIAQEVIEQFPEVCKERTTAEGDTHLGVDYERLVPALIGAIRELKDEIKSLKEKIK